MITRALLLVTAWFIISVAGLILGGGRLRRGNLSLSLAWLAVVLLLGDLWALQSFGFPLEVLALTGITSGLALLYFRWWRDWNAFGQVTWLMTGLVSFWFMAYAFSIIISMTPGPFSFLGALVIFFAEGLGLLLALAHTHENLEVACRTSTGWHKRLDRIAPAAGYTPKVSLHVPAYNEPPEVVAGTLRALAELDYPDYEVLVIDNNTPDEATWRPIAELCRELGPRFRFLHLAHWPGYKSGALNFALAQTAPEAELIATVDADYLVDPGFLRETVPVFVDPQVAFIQSPQDYRDYEGHPYFEAIYYSYKYFFEVTMPARNEYNAIIFGGTMGLIRKTVLQEIGGWDEWCITEDAEASLRILKRGYTGLYYNKSMGRGLMPLSFDGLKKQRFRWCFGGVQILKKHWEALMPWAHRVNPENRLTGVQRYFYLMGGLQWFTDLFNLLFTFVLVLVGLFSLFSINFALRPLTGPLLVLPAIFLALNLWRFIWVLRHALHLSWAMALWSMYALFSMGWTVAHACLQGLIQPKGVFLRTPKTKEQGRFLKALQSARWETSLGLVCGSLALILLAGDLSLSTLSLILLLLWKSSFYLSAPLYSLLSLIEQRGRREEG